MNILITGSAGFIGFHLAQRFVREGHRVTGLDNLNHYYDVQLKFDRLQQVGILEDQIQYGKVTTSALDPGYRFVEGNLEDGSLIERIFQKGSFDVVINLAAQAGVRHSLTHPHDYIQSNVVGFLNVLEGCRTHAVKHLLYASSSSVYGLNEQMPLSTKQGVDHPMSLYAATKKSNELMAHSYSHLYGLPTTGLRFFTVYGPWGRPDMALFIFTKAILAGEPIRVFNHGNMVRDFTYVDDIVEGIVRLSGHIPGPDTAWSGHTPSHDSSSAPWRVFNIGNNSEVQLLDFVHAIEKHLGKKAEIRLEPIQPGDVPVTRADVSEMMEAVGYRPDTPVSEGIGRFVDWYLDYYGGRNAER
ncbi:MAG: NAD-dependent epimerase [Saprospiraceae bacterium]|nr:NAD-dependent epimerase [Saprospiraceae bacterium]